MNYPLADKKSKLLCCYLVSLGIKKGDRIGLLMGNNPEYVLFAYAAARVGFVIVPIDIYASDTDIERIVKEVGIKILYYDGSQMKVRSKDFLKNPNWIPDLHRIDLFACSSPKENEYALESSWNKEYDQSILTIVEMMMDQVELEDEFCIIYTSGSTGEDKGTIRSLRSFLRSDKDNSKAIKKIFTITSKLFKVEALNLYPFYHYAGFVSIALFILGGSTMRVSYINNFQTAQAGKVLKNSAIRLINGTPSMILMLINYMEESHLEFRKSVAVTVAGAATDFDYIKRILNIKRVIALGSTYGSTECGSIAFRLVLKENLGFSMRTLLMVFKMFGYVDGIFKEEDFIKEQGVLLGRVIKGVEVKVFDEETGRYVEDGKPGEICTRTLGIEQGHYMNISSENFLYTKDGYMKTGDLGILRDGILYLIGRKKHIIIRGGANISCLELESVIMKCPIVKEVAVCGVPDKIYGEEIYACISTLNNEHNDIHVIHDFLEERMSKLKVPKYYSLYQKLPMTGSGKCDYIFLKNRYNEVNGDYASGTSYEIIKI
jgi:fatty-acyl-CoA synthase